MFTLFTSGQSLANNRVTIARFKYLNGNIVNDNAIYLDLTIGCIMMQVDGTLGMDDSDVKVTSC